MWKGQTAQPREGSTDYTNHIILHILYYTLYYYVYDYTAPVELSTRDTD